MSIIACLIAYLQRKGDSVVKLHSAGSPSKTLMIKEDEPLQVDNEEVGVAPYGESLDGSSVSLTHWAIPGGRDCDDRRLKFLFPTKPERHRELL